MSCVVHCQENQSCFKRVVVGALRLGGAGLVPSCGAAAAMNTETERTHPANSDLTERQSYC
jgi:hypothetical protein